MDEIDNKTTDGGLWAQFLWSYYILPQISQMFIWAMSYQRHNISNHHQLYCLYHNLFRPTKQNIKLCIVGPLYWKSSNNIGVPLTKTITKAINVENVPMS